jgi:hypothetical protein
VETHQLDLFAGIVIPRSGSRPESLSMDADALVQWKIRIATHQQQTKENQPVQGALFDVAGAHVDPDKIDPFNLRPYPMQYCSVKVCNCQCSGQNHENSSLSASDKSQFLVIRTVLISNVFLSLKLIVIHFS